MIESILLVDGNRTTDGLKKCLTREGYLVDIAGYLADAIQKVEGDPPYSLMIFEPYILSDCTEASNNKLKGLLQKAKGKGTSLMACTSYTTQTLSLEYGIALGVDYDYHSRKPMLGRELLKQIQQVMEARKSQ